MFITFKRAYLLFSITISGLFFIVSPAGYISEIFTSSTFSAFDGKRGRYIVLSGNMIAPSKRKFVSGKSLFIKSLTSCGTSAHITPVAVIKHIAIASKNFFIYLKTPLTFDIIDFSGCACLPVCNSYNCLYNCFSISFIFVGMCTFNTTI